MVSKNTTIIIILVIAAIAMFSLFALNRDEVKVSLDDNNKSLGLNVSLDDKNVSIEMDYDVNKTDVLENITVEEAVNVSLNDTQ